jgi:hypothetical protein
MFLFTGGHKITCLFNVSRIYLQTTIISINPQGFTNRACCRFISNFRMRSFVDSLSSNLYSRVRSFSTDDDDSDVEMLSFCSVLKGIVLSMSLISYTIYIIYDV